jgi:hypothetical protein
LYVTAAADSPNSTNRTNSHEQSDDIIATSFPSTAKAPPTIPHLSFDDMDKYRFPIKGDKPRMLSAHPKDADKISELGRESSNVPRTLTPRALLRPPRRRRLLSKQNDKATRKLSSIPSPRKPKLYQTLGISILIFGLFMQM